MRPRSRIGELLFGKGFMIALTITLAIAAVLVVVGLVQELTGASTTVVAAQRTLVASQMAVTPLVQTTPEDPDDETDPSADFHPDSAEMAGPAPAPSASDAAAARSTGTPESGVAAASAEGAPEPGPSPVAEAPVTPAPSPEAVAEAAPSPAPVAARVRLEPEPHGPPRAAADLPIVMYHHIGPLPPNPDVFRRDLTVSPELFERTLVQLDERQVETVTMADLFEHFAGGRELPKRAAILTFDDGYDDVYEYAFHALQQHGMMGTFFVTTDFVERPGYLTWAQIQEMADAGMEIAAHSSNHADFTRIGPAELRRQLVEPKAILEDHLGQLVRFMAYPSGKYNAAVMAATRAAGYEAAVTVIHGTHHVPGMAFEVRRVRAHGADSAAEIVARMTPPSWRQ